MPTTLAAASAFVDLSINDGRFREGLKNIHNAVKPTMIAVNQLGDGLKSLGGMIPSLAGGGLAAAAGLASIAVPVAAANPAVVERLSFAMQDLMAVVGQGLVPYVEMATQAVRGLADWLYNLDPVMKAVIAGGVVLSVGMVVLGTVITGVTLAASAATAAMAGLAAATTAFVSAVGGPIVAIGVVVVAIAAAVGSLVATHKMVNNAANDAKRKSSFGLGFHEAPKFMQPEDLRKNLQIDAFRLTMPNEKEKPEDKTAAGVAMLNEKADRQNVLLEQIRDKRSGAITA